ncbi:MAG: PDZ domain-containing protein [Bdellovibrionaceae bacterium]|nr:PDZ domain-containing protein [Pseudobdellovibrionaceae bacterium]
MKIFAFFFASFFVMSSIQAGPTTKFKLVTDANPSIEKTDDVWSDVKVDFQWLTGIINYKTCGQSQKAYLGCVLAVQTFGSVIQKNLEVIPVQMLNGEKAFFQAERLALIEVPVPNITNAKEAFNYFDLARRQLMVRFLGESETFIKTSNTDFERLLTEIYQQANRNVKPANYLETIAKFLEISVDPHTSIRPTKELEMAIDGSDNSFVGVGIEFTKLAQGLLIKRVLKNSGAELARLQPGDVIIAVDGQDFAGLNDEGIVERLRGAEGTSVSVTVQRGDTTLRVSLTRKKIVSPVVSSAAVNFDGKSIVYIRLTNFMYSQVCSEIESIVTTWDNQNTAGYVLDLRNNPGGDVQIAACVAGIFLGRKKVVSYFEKTTPFRSRVQVLESKANVTTTKPISVLINAYSASASEIIAGAFRDHNRALIVGQTSFGKGSHQGCAKIKNNEALTICSTGGLFFAPSGESNQTVGIVPHISVYINKEPQDLELYAQREAQMYLFPLQPKKMAKPPKGSWNLLKAPTACLETLNLSSKYEKAVGTVLYFKDYQMLNALGAVVCQ